MASLDTVSLGILLGALLVLAGILSSLIALRFGAPLLLVFLLLGMLAGESGPGGIAFNDVQTAYTVGSIALALILFDGGLRTRFQTFRSVLAPALVLATVGVLLTAALTGLVARLALDLGWIEALLLGAVVASTDAAAVFFLLHARGLRLRPRVGATLEVESGTNDPIAIFLTILLVEILLLGEQAWQSVVLTLAHQAVVGGIIGVVGGRIIVIVLNRVGLSQGLHAPFVATSVLVVFGVAQATHASGFLAVYLAGLISGNSNIRAVTILKRFQDGMSWLAQIIMFLILGLFATPSQFPAILLPAVLLGLFLIFVARPIAVWLCLMPFRLPRPEVAFVSWVGLRGAVSILLAITPLLGGLENGRLIFNTAFIVVLVSLVVQGWTVGPLARRLGLIVPARLGPLDKVELELPGSAHHELLAYRVAPGSPVARGERIPRWARPSLVLRDGRSMRFQDMGRLAAGDHVYIFVPDRYPGLLDKLFASRAVVDPEDADFFGAFAVDPARPATELEAAYAPGLTEEERKLTVGDLVMERLGGHAEYADRVPLGSIELIVRDVDDKGRITGLGLSLEPTAPVARVPVFLSAGEIGDRIVAFVRNWRKRTKKQSAEAQRTETQADAEPAPQPVVEKSTGEG